MPRNYQNQAKIDHDFSELKNRAANQAKYHRLLQAVTDDISNQTGKILPPGYRLLRTTSDSAEFEVALVADATETVIYYVHCVVIEDVHLNAKPVTQALVWRSSRNQYQAVTRDMAQHVFHDYLLMQYHVIVSDSCQTREGRDFWERQLDLALCRHKHVYRYDRLQGHLQEITDFDTIEDNSADLWGDDAAYEHILAVISQDVLN